MSDVQELYDLTESLVDCLAGRIGGRFDSKGISPYNVPVIPQECGRHLQAAIESIYPSDNFPFISETSTSCGAAMVVADVLITFAECGPQMLDNGDMDPAEVTKFGRRMRDVHNSLWTGVTCCLGDLDDYWSWAVRNMTPYDDQQGLFMGSNFAITIGRVTRCVDCG